MTAPADLSPDAARAYHALVEAPGSPVWTHPREDRLTPTMRRDVTAFGRLLRTQPPAWRPGGEPAWLRGWLARTWPIVPALTARGPTPLRLVDVQPTSRADLVADAASFVPTTVDSEELIAYQTSGTAGAPTWIPSHPVAAARYYPLILAAADARVDIRPRPDVLDWVTLISQDVGGFIVPSYSTTLGSLTAQVNLRPHGWMTDGDAARFLADHDPQVLTGDPVAFGDLLDLSPACRPRLLVSAASRLADGLRARLEDRFGCPVLDLYSLTESGPVATALVGGGRHQLIQPRLFVEVLRPDGSRVAEGERGEITLTGGMNPALPLLRYRTGDHGSLVWPEHALAPVLVDLDGRRPVVFIAADGRVVNSHSITVALRPMAVARFTLHQSPDRGLLLGLDDRKDARIHDIRRLVRGVLGDLPLAVQAITPQAGGKVVPFTTG